MPPVPPNINRFFICPQYSVAYRRLRRFQWLSEGQTDYAVLFLLKGLVDYEVNDGGGEIGAENLLLGEPGKSFRASGKDVECLILTVSPAYILDNAVRMGLLGAGATVAFKSAVIDKDRRLLQLGKELVWELAEPQPGKEIIIAALTEQILVHLLRRYSKMRRSDELELSRVGLVDRRIRRAIELIHAQLDGELSLKEMAAASYLSPFHFARLFKKLTGTTPHAYLARLRISRAQSLLAETNLSVTEIGVRVGYSSSSHFTKAYRQATGLTPRGFRQALISRIEH